jgi:hypothetical protein
LEHAALDDPELRLPRIADGDGWACAGAELLQPRAAALRPAHRPLHRCGGRLMRSREREALVEDHRDVGAEPRLDVGRALGRQQVARAVEVRLEGGPLFRDDAPPGQAEDLIPAAVGEDGPAPADEAVEAAAAGDQFVAGTQEKVIGVAEDDLRADFLEVAVPHRLDGALRADRHEGGRLDDAVRRPQLAAPGGAVAGRQREAERRGHVLY